MTCGKLIANKSQNNLGWLFPVTASADVCRRVVSENSCIVLFGKHSLRYRIYMHIRNEHRFTDRQADRHKDARLCWMGLLGFPRPTRSILG